MTTLLSKFVANQSEVIRQKCVCTADPAVSVDWFRQEIALKNTSESVVISTSTTFSNGLYKSVGVLDILNAREEDAGEYTCRCTNQVASVNGTTRVIVNGM